MSSRPSQQQQQQTTGAAAAAPTHTMFASSAAGSTFPTVAAAMKEIERLTAKLALSDEWVNRLQSQIQDLLRLPYNDTEKLREKMTNPDIAIPLLQCYDAAMQEKEEEMTKLRAESDRLRQLLRMNDVEGRDAIENAKLTEETAKATLNQMESEKQSLQHHIQRLSNENHALKEKMMSAIDGESRASAEAQRQIREKEELQQVVSQQKKTIVSLEDELEATNRRLKQLNTSGEAEKNTNEATKIQIHLLNKENEDKMTEIERLRAKMIQALKAASENHAAHMKIVEEKHRETIACLKDEVRAGEVSVLKLRAQLSRVDVLGRGSSCGGGHSSMDGASGVGGGGVIASTTHTMLQHTSEMQAVELRRLHAELSTMTAQRDDALFRLERATITRRGESDQQLQILNKDTAVMQTRIASLESRLEKLEEELAEEKDAHRTLKDAHRATASELRRTQDALEDTERTLASAKVQTTSFSEKLGAKDAKIDQLAEELERNTRHFESRLHDAQKEHTSQRERLASSISALEMSVAEERRKHSDVSKTLQSVTASLNEKSRQLEAAGAARETLTAMLQQHKATVSAADDRLRAFADQEQVMSADMRDIATEVERLRLELGRCANERDRAVAEMKTLRRYQKQGIRF